MPARLDSSARRAGRHSAIANAWRASTIWKTDGRSIRRSPICDREAVATRTESGLPDCNRRRAASRGLLRALDVGEPAQAKPLFKTLAERSRSLELDLAGRQRGPEAEVAEKDPSQVFDFGPYEQVDVEARIGRAEIDLAFAAHQPPGPFRRRHVGELELGADASRRKGLRLDHSPQVPHQDPHVELFLDVPGAVPALPPFAQQLDQRGKLPP